MSNRDLAKKLTSHGLRPTAQRIAVYDYLLQHPVHPSADTIYQAISDEFPTFSRTTIYNTLRALFDAGLIRIVTINADEQRFDGNPDNHGHFRCTHCGNIGDFAFDQDQLSSMVDKGFEVHTQDVYFTGLCPNCVRLFSHKNDE